MVERKSCKYLEFLGSPGWWCINFGTLILTISESWTELCTCVLGPLKENKAFEYRGGERKRKTHFRFLKFVNAVKWELTHNESIKRRNALCERLVDVHGYGYRRISERNVFCWCISLLCLRCNTNKTYTLHHILGGVYWWVRSCV